MMGMMLQVQQWRFCSEKHDSFPRLLARASTANATIRYLVLINEIIRSYLALNIRKTYNIQS